jgi:indole-3-acetate monooxygenase
MQKIPDFTTNIDLLNTCKRNSLPSQWLSKVYHLKWFKLFVPKKQGGLELSLPDALQQMYIAGSIHGSLGWCVNLGAGAGYFSGFFDEKGAKEIFAPDKAVIAGSGQSTGTARHVDGGFILNGNWDKCTGAAHATTFTVNAEMENGAIRSFAISRSQVKVQNVWTLFALKGTSSQAIHIKNAFVPENHSFEIGRVKSNSDYPLYKIDFTPFARFCMAATYVGMVRCLADQLHDISPESTTTLEAKTRSALKDIMEMAQRMWDKARGGVSVSDEAGIQLCIAGHSKTLFDAACNVFYHHGMRLSDENNLAHYAYRDVMLGSQHYLLK